MTSSSESFEVLPLVIHQHIVTYCHLDQLKTLLECNKTLFHALVLSSKDVLQTIGHYVRVSLPAYEGIDLASNAVAILMQILSFGDKQYQQALENEEIPQKPHFFCDAIEILYELFDNEISEGLRMPFMKYCINCIKNRTQSQLAMKLITKQKNSICNDYGFTDIYYLILHKMLSLYSENGNDYQELHIADQLIDNEHILNVILDEMKILDIPEINENNIPRFSSIFHYISKEKNESTEYTANSNSSFFCHRLNLLSKLIQGSKTLTLEVKQCVILFESLIVKNKNSFQIEKAFDFFSSNHSRASREQWSMVKKIDIFQPGSKLLLFQNYILPRYRLKNENSEEMENIRNMSKSELRCFCNFMLMANSEMNYVRLSSSKSLSLVLDYHQLLGLQELWNIILNANLIGTNAMAKYFSYLNHLPLVSDDNAQQAIDIRRQFLDKCMMELEKCLIMAKNDDTILRKICRILHMIKRLLFHVRLTSRLVIDHPLHIQLQNSQTIDIALNGTLDDRVFDNERISIKDNMLCTEIQQLIANRCQSQTLHPQLINLSVNHMSQVRTLNPTALQTIGEMKEWFDILSAPNATLNVNLTNNYNLTHQRPLVDENNEMVPDCTRALTQIFMSYHPSNDDNSYTLEDLKRYILGCGAGESSASKSRLQNIFREHGTHADPVAMDALSVEGFLSFYRQACVDRVQHVWNDLYVHGYRNDLRTVSEMEAFEKQLFTHENCLLYVMVENEKYWNIIWDCFQLNDNKINVKAFDILLHLPTKNEIRELFEVGIETVVDFEEIMFDKKGNNYWVEYCLFLCEWLFTNNVKWRKMFLDKNGVQCMVKLLEILSLQMIQLSKDEECIADDDRKEMKENEEESAADQKIDGQLKDSNDNNIVVECILSILRLLFSLMELEKEEFEKYHEIFKPQMEALAVNIANRKNAISMITMLL